MHTEMWQHPATRENVSVLRERGVHIIEPDSGALAGDDTGPGRLPEPEAIFAALKPHLNADAEPRPGPLRGAQFVVSAGGTREAIDPVRFLGNRSSGRQGIAIARAAAAAGAHVTLVAANVEDALLAGLRGVDIENVSTAAELETAMNVHAGSADVLVMAAAVADYRPAAAGEHKLKKNGDEGMVLRLEQTPDILAGLVANRRSGQVIVGFAAETGDEQTAAIEHARAKARRKQADLLVFNEVSATAGFGAVPNAVVILDSDGTDVSAAAGTKDEVGTAVVAEIARRCGEVSSAPEGTH